MIGVKTQAGHQVMKDQSVVLTPRPRTVFIQFDGKRTLDEVRAATAAAGVTQEDIDRLFELGLISDASPQTTAAQAATTASAAEAATQHKQRTSRQRYAEAYPIATQLTASLGLRGFRLNLAVEAAANYEVLRALGARIREAVRPEKYAALDYALNDR